MLNIDTNKLSGQMFANLGPKKVVFDLQNSGLGFYDGNGNLVTLGKAKNGRKVLVQNPLDVSVAVPAFAVRTKVADLSAGDVVYSPVTQECGFFLNTETAKVLKDGETGKEDELENDAINILKADGAKGNLVIAQNPVLGPGVLAVKSFANGGMEDSLPMMLMLSQGLEKNDDLGKLIAMSMFSGNNVFSGFSSGGNDMNPMMMMLLMGDGEMDIETLLLMSMMGQCEDNAGSMNSMLPLLLLKDDFDSKKMLPLLLMGQWAGGGQSNMMQTMLMLELFRN